MTKKRFIAKGGGKVIEFEQSVLPPETWYEIISSIDQLPLNEIKELVSFLRRRVNDKQGSLDFTEIDKKTGLISILKEFEKANYIEKGQQKKRSSSLFYLYQEIRYSDPTIKPGKLWLKLFEMAVHGYMFDYQGERYELTFTRGEDYRNSKYTICSINDRSGRRDGRSDKGLTKGTLYNWYSQDKKSGKNYFSR